MNASSDSASGIKGCVSVLLQGPQKCRKKSGINTSSQETKSEANPNMLRHTARCRISHISCSGAVRFILSFFERDCDLSFCLNLLFLLRHYMSALTKSTFISTSLLKRFRWYSILVFKDGIGLKNFRPDPVNIQWTNTHDWLLREGFLLYSNRKHSIKWCTSGIKPQLVVMLFSWFVVRDRMTHNYKLNALFKSHNACLNDSRRGGKNRVKKWIMRLCDIKIELLIDSLWGCCSAITRVIWAGDKIWPIKACALPGAS